jgi:CRP/FNR family cyclic AMP-dependent transcriptional regulator
MVDAARHAILNRIAGATLGRLEKAAIVDVIHRESAFSEMFIVHLLGRTIRVEADLVDELFNSGEKPLARMLLLLANFGKDGKPEPTIAKSGRKRWPR